jgi:hypothetical protein
MLRILGSPRKLCDGWTRREMLRAGGLGLLGISLPQYLRLAEVQAARAPGTPAPGFGSAKSCILLYLYGSPSQLETFDPKPDAPAEIRGELKSIASSLAGVRVCERLPRVARLMDRVSIVRSMTHPYPIHGVAYALTGTPTIDLPMELNPGDSRHWPFLGSVVEFLARRGTGSQPAVPGNVALPFPFSSQRIGEVPRAGPYAAFLGSAYNPVYTTFHGKATRQVVKTLLEQKTPVADPYLGVTPESRIELASATQLPAGLTLDRLDGRRSLMQQFDQARHALGDNPAGRGMDRHRDMAYALIGSDRLRAALDLDREPLTLRESYGMTLFGQAALTARRLVEAGSRFVTVFWDEYGLAGSAWDTHWDHYPRMKDELLPGLDGALAGLLADLDARGLLDETLVLCLSEHGRTPKLQTNVSGGGRDHWSQCYSALLAGGGIRRGNVVGRSDRIAGTVAERPVSPKDILATVYHLLGIDPATTLTDRTGRPVPLVGDGAVVPELLA